LGFLQEKSFLAHTIGVLVRPLDFKPPITIKITILLLERAHYGALALGPHQRPDWLPAAPAAFCCAGGHVMGVANL
jgi:hypothetical protein